MGITQLPGWRIRLYIQAGSSRHLSTDFKIAKAKDLGEHDYHHKHEEVFSQARGKQRQPRQTEEYVYGMGERKLRAQTASCSKKMREEEIVG